MELYFAPLACSLATRIALYEAGAEARFVQVDLKAKRTEDGADFLAINPMGQVPAVRTDSGEVLTENGVVLQFVADSHPGSGLAPASGLERYRLQQWLSFIGTELHKAVFIPLLDPKAPEGAKAFARDKAGARLAHLERHLTGRHHLLDRFSVADAYLVTILNWAKHSGVDLAPYPTVAGYYTRLLGRPAVAKAVREEYALYAEEQKRNKAA